MRKYYFLTFIIIFSFINPLLAQTQKDGDTFGGFGGPFLQVSKMQGGMNFKLGGGGGLVYNHKYFFGGFGQGNVVEIEPNIDSLMDYKLNYGHGGLWFGLYPLFVKNNQILFSFRIAWGQALLSDGKQNDFSSEYMVLEPEIIYELKISTFFKMGAGISYPIYSPIKIPGFSENDFSKLNVTIHFKFGSF